MWNNFARVILHPFRITLATLTNRPRKSAIATLIFSEKRRGEAAEG